MTIPNHNLPCGENPRAKPPPDDIIDPHMSTWHALKRCFVIHQESFPPSLSLRLSLFCILFLPFVLCNTRRVIPALPPSVSLLYVISSFLCSTPRVIPSLLPSSFLLSHRLPLALHFYFLFSCPLLFIFLILHESLPPHILPSVPLCLFLSVLYIPRHFHVLFTVLFFIHALLSSPVLPSVSLSFLSSLSLILITRLPLSFPCVLFSLLHVLYTS